MKKIDQILAISVRQPYAESIIRGEKVIEYRSKHTHVRGTIYVYAAKGKESSAIFNAYQVDEEQVSYGKIIGTVDLVHSERSYEYPEWYEWQLENPKKFDEPLTPMNRALPVFWYPEFK